MEPRENAPVSADQAASVSRRTSSWLAGSGRMGHAPGSHAAHADSLYGIPQISLGCQVDLIPLRMRLLTCALVTVLAVLGTEIGMLL